LNLLFILSVLVVPSYGQAIPSEAIRTDILNELREIRQERNQLDKAKSLELARRNQYFARRNTTAAKLWVEAADALAEERKSLQARFRDVTSRAARAYGLDLTVPEKPIVDGPAEGVVPQWNPELSEDDLSFGGTKRPDGRIAFIDYSFDDPADLALTAPDGKVVVHPRAIDRALDANDPAELVLALLHEHLHVVQLTSTGWISKEWREVTPYSAAAKLAERILSGPSESVAVRLAAYKDRLREATSLYWTRRLTFRQSRPYPDESQTEKAELIVHAMNDLAESLSAAREEVAAFKRKRESKKGRQTGRPGSRKTWERAWRAKETARDRAIREGRWNETIGHIYLRSFVSKTCRYYRKESNSHPPSKEFDFLFAALSTDWFKGERDPSPMRRKLSCEDWLFQKLAFLNSRSSERWFNIDRMGVFWRTYLQEYREIKKLLTPVSPPPRAITPPRAIAEPGDHRLSPENSDNTGSDSTTIDLDLPSPPPPRDIDDLNLRTLEDIIDSL